MRDSSHRKLIVGSVVITFCVSVCSLLAAEDSASQKKADQRFDDLLAAAKKDPQKTDWRVLRAAFAETSRYNPGNLNWNEELDNLADRVVAGNAKETESILNKLLEREGCMRLDALKLAVSFYEKTGQKEKARLYGEFVEKITGAILIPGMGLAVEKPINVLFFDEESILLQRLKAKFKKLTAIERNGHQFHVITAQAEKGNDERSFYFNIDLPTKALSKAADKLIDEKGPPDLDK